MSDAPERIWSTDEDGKWSDVEYVRADLYEFMRSEFDRIRKKNAALEQERNELRNGLMGIPCFCVKAGSSDGTTTVMTKCRRCTALGSDNE